MTRCLKVLREAACLQLAERLFQSFTPLNEKHFLPFSVPFFGNLRSVDVCQIQQPNTTANMVQIHVIFTRKTFV